MAMGSIRKRTDSKGRVSYQITLDLDRNPITGERIRRYKTVHGSKKQAEAELQKMLASPDGNPSNTIQASARLREWMQVWLNAYLPDIAQTTRDSYEEKIRNYIDPGLGSVSLSQLDATMIQRFVNSMLEKGLSPKSIRNTFNNLNAALNKAVEIKVLKYNPCAGVVLPKLKRYNAQTYSQEQLKELLTYSLNDPNVCVIVVLGALVGLRRGEMTALHWDNVDFTNQTITVCENRVQSSRGIIEKGPKSEAGKRTIRVGKEAMELLHQVKDMYDDASVAPYFHDLGYVLCKENGDPYRPDSVTQLWDRFITRSPLPKIRLHDLRHTNATSLIASGVSARVVQHRLGHADVSTTLQRYVHVRPEMDQEAADVIDALIFA